MNLGTWLDTAIGVALFFLAMSFLVSAVVEAISQIMAWRATTLREGIANLLNSVGLDASVEIEHNTMAPEHNDIYLLCCDGLNDLVDDWMIREIMTSGDSLEVVAENLIRAANNNGGTDNITVVLAQTFVDPLWVPQHQYSQQMHGY